MSTQRLLIIEVIAARNLIACERRQGSSNPYVVVSLLDIANRPIKNEKQTGTPRMKTLSPRFEQRMTLGLNYYIIFILTERERDRERKRYLYFYSSTFSRTFILLLLLIFFFLSSFIEILLSLYSTLDILLLFFDILHYSFLIFTSTFTLILTFSTLLFTI